MRLIDTHAHLYSTDFQKDLLLVLERAQKNYVEKIYMPNIDETTIDSIIEMADRYQTICLPMMGIHPCHITKDFIQQLYLVEQWLNNYPFLGIGEIGIDLYHDTSLSKEQQEAFTIQLDFAKQHNLPVSIHCRNAFKEMITLLEKEQDGSLRGVIHCFTGTLMEAERYTKLGFYLGVGGVVTMQKNGLTETIATIDLSHLVLETDSPYLAPVPYRGKRNEPAYLLYIAEKVAAVKQVSLEEVAARTTQNAEKLFEVARINS
jgi:TatD DNase family protein